MIYKWNLSCTFSDTRYAISFLPSLPSFLLLLLSLSFFLPLSFLSVCMYVSVVSSIIFHFSRFCPFLAASSAALSSLRTTLLSLLTGHRDISLPSFFHSIALLSTALPFPSLSPSLYSLSLSFYSPLFICSCLTVVFHLQHPLCPIYLLSPFAQSVNTRCLLFFSLSQFTPSSSYYFRPPFLTLLLTLFLPRSPTLCLFLSSFFLILCRSILVSYTLFLFIYIPFSFPPPVPLFLFFL